MAVDTIPVRPPAQPPARAGRLRQRATERLRELGRTPWGVVLGLALLTVVSAVLSTRQFSFHYWVDEGISVGIASHPLSELPRLLRQDGSPPLYYLLLHVWMQVWGRGEVATHLLSLIFALLTVPVAYLAGAGLFGRRVGMYCAVLVAGLPFLVSYAQETRMYSIVLLLSLIVAASFLHVFVHRRRGYLPVFVLSLTAALYTQNWALFLGLGCFLAFLVCVRLLPAARRDLWRDGALVFGAVAIFYLPWVPTLLYQAKHTGAPWALAPDVWSMTQGLYFLVGGRGAAVALLLAGGSGLFALKQGRALPAATRATLASLFLIGFGTLLIAWVEAKLTPSWAPRYLAAIVGPLVLLAGLGLSRAGRLGLAALVLVWCFWVLDPRTPSLDSKSNVATAARVVRAQLGPGSLVLSTQPEQVPALAYYLPRVGHFGTPLGAVADPRVVDWRNALARFRRSSVRRVLVPMLATMRPGERVALVVPALIAHEPEWMRLIRRSTRLWSRYLADDRRLVLLKVTDPNQYKSQLPVQISLYAVRR